MHYAKQKQVADVPLNMFKAMLSSKKLRRYRTCKYVIDELAQSQLNHRKENTHLNVNYFGFGRDVLNEVAKEMDSENILSTRQF